MPRIKRWFPVSHDINRDPEVLELTDKYGLTGLKVWLEILSISDRNEGLCPGQPKQLFRSLAVVCNSTAFRTEQMLSFMEEKGWIIWNHPTLGRVSLKSRSSLTQVRLESHSSETQVRVD